jgi:HK97 family phage major capsid protein
MPTIASAAPAVAVADWRKFYCVVDIGQPLMIRDSVTSKGRTLFYCEKRVAGGVLDFNAGKLLVMSA